jgi:hypothetical protein
VAKQTAQAKESEDAQTCEMAYHLALQFGASANDRSV